VDVNDRIRWEVQWHPANGARIRRLRITSRGVRRLIFALGIVVWVVLAGGLLAGFEGLLARSAIDSARRQNTALMVQQETLREQAFDLAVRLSEEIERGRGTARSAGVPGHAWEGRRPRPPARDAGSDTILAWLSEQGARLEAVGNELAAARAEVGSKQASVPVPAAIGIVPAGNAAMLQVAELGSGKRQEAAPAKR
jgi:hypothetical protein